MVPGLSQWVQDQTLPQPTRGVGLGLGSDLALLWCGMWSGNCSSNLFPNLGTSNAMDVALKSKHKNKKIGPQVQVLAGTLGLGLFSSL